MIHVALNHVSRYRYDRRISLSPQIVRLRPAPHCRTRVLSYSLDVAPQGHFINWQQDPFSNYLARLVFPEKTQELLLTVGLVVEMSVYNPFDFFLEPSAETFPFRYESHLEHDLRPYVAHGEAGPQLRRFLAAIDQRPRRTIDFLVELNQRLQRQVRYLIRMEPGVQTPEQTLEDASREADQAAKDEQDARDTIQALESQLDEAHRRVTEARRRLREIAEAEKLAPDSPRVLYERAQTYIRDKRNLDQARALLKKYITCSLTPDDPPRERAEELLKKVSGA